MNLQLASGRGALAAHLIAQQCRLFRQYWRMASASQRIKQRAAMGAAARPTSRLCSQVAQVLDPPCWTATPLGSGRSNTPSVRVWPNAMHSSADQGAFKCSCWSPSQCRQRAVGRRHRGAISTACGISVALATNRTAGFHKHREAACLILSWQLAMHQGQMPATQQELPTGQASGTKTTSNTQWNCSPRGCRQQQAGWQEQQRRRRQSLRRLC